MRYNLLLLFGFVIFGLNAQEKGNLDITITEGELFKTEHKKRLVLERLGDGKDGGYIILSGTSRGNYLIQHINAVLEIDAEVELNFGKESLISQFTIDEKLHLVTAVGDRDTKEAVYKVYSSLDFGKTFSDKEFLRVTLSTFDIEIGFDRFIDFMKPSFKEDKGDDGLNAYVAFSENKNFFGITFDRSETETSEHLMYVFNKDFEQVFQNSYSNSVKERKYVFKDMNISDKDGTLYFLSRITTKENIFRGVRAYKFELLQITENQIRTFEFQKGGISYGILRIVFDKTDQTLKAIGTYSERSDRYDEGVVFLSFDMNNLNNVTTKLSPFSEDFIALKFGRKKNKGLYNYFLRDILQKDNGNYVLISEELDAIDRKYEFGAKDSNYFIQFKDILIAELSKDGDLNWAQNINKHQEISKLSYAPVSSFSGGVFGNDIFLLFNAKKILKKKTSDLFYSSSPSPSRQYIVRIDESGLMTYQEYTSSNPKLLYATGEAMFFENAFSSGFILQGQNLYKRQYMKFEMPR